MKTHVLKCWETSFRQTASGRKPFEVRVNDRDYSVGDQLVLCGWDPTRHVFTGEVLIAWVSTVVQGRWGLPADVCVLGLCIGPGITDWTPFMRKDGAPQWVAMMYAQQRLL